MEELRGQRVLLITTSMGFASVRVLTGPLGATVQEVPAESVTKMSPTRLTRQDVLERVVAYADGGDVCRLCGKSRAPDTMAHEADCPIPDALKLLALQSKRRAKTADVVDEFLEDDGLRRTRSRPKRRGRIKGRPGPR